jgi:hypothetical protein
MNRPQPQTKGAMEDIPSNKEALATMASTDQYARTGMQTNDQESQRKICNYEVDFMRIRSLWEMKQQRLDPLHDPIHLEEKDIERMARFNDRLLLSQHLDPICPQTADTVARWIPAR